MTQSTGNSLPPPLCPSSCSRIWKIKSGMYETENGRYGRSQRIQPHQTELLIDLEELKSHIDPHKSVYRTEFMPFSPADLSSCNLSQYLVGDKNEDYMRRLRMHYPMESSSRTAFRDWSGALHSSPSATMPAKPVLDDTCPFGVLSRSKLDTNTQYSNDYVLPRAFARERLHRSQSRDTFQFCQGGVPRVISSNSSSRSRSLGPSNRIPC
jgi:hypothetical protein